MLEPQKKFSEHNIQIKVQTLDHFKGGLPQYESLGASGFDLRAQLDNPVSLKPGGRALIPTGLIFEIPTGFELQIRPRSGLALKKGLTLMNSPGTIDADYRGELKIILAHFGQEDIVIQDQLRVAQAVVCPVFQARFQLSDKLGNTSRGSGGFGSTGIK